MKSDVLFVCVLSCWFTTDFRSSQRRPALARRDGAVSACLGLLGRDASQATRRGSEETEPPRSHLLPLVVASGYPPNGKQNLGVSLELKQQVNYSIESAPAGVGPRGGRSFQTFLGTIILSLPEQTWIIFHHFSLYQDLPRVRAADCTSANPWFSIRVCPLHLEVKEAVQLQ